MEKIVKVLGQSPMRKVDWKNNRGESVVIKSVEVKFSDGIDTFIAEMTDRLAEMAEEKPLRTDAFYGVQFRMSTRSWESKQDNQKREATTIRVVGLEMLWRSRYILQETRGRR